MNRRQFLKVGAGAGLVAAAPAGVLAAADHSVGALLGGGALNGISMAEYNSLANATMVPPPWALMRRRLFDDQFARVKWRTAWCSYRKRLRKGLVTEQSAREIYLRSKAEDAKASNRIEKSRWGRRITAKVRAAFPNWSGEWISELEW